MVIHLCLFSEIWSSIYERNTNIFSTVRAKILGWFVPDLYLEHCKQSETGQCHSKVANRRGRSTNATRSSCTGMPPPALGGAACLLTSSKPASRTMV